APAWTIRTSAPSTFSISATMSSRGVWPIVIAPTRFTPAVPRAAAPAVPRADTDRSRVSSSARPPCWSEPGRAPASSTPRRRAGDRPAFARRVPRHAQVIALANRPRGARIPDRQIRVGADADRALAREQTEDPRGVFGQRARHPRWRQAAFHHALVPDQRRERLERWSAERDGHALRVDEDVRPARLLELRQPRRVIARDRVNRAGRRAGPHRLAIAAMCRPQRRADLGERAELCHFLVAQQEVLRARLRPHPLALRLRALDALEPESRGEVDDVDR